MLSDIIYRGRAFRIAVGIMALLLATKFIRNDATGGDCTSIGAWNAATKTCMLTTDLGETIQIDSDGITLNGNGHTIMGSNTGGNGVYLFSRTGVNLKNLNIRQFSTGIFLDYSSNNMLSGNNASNNPADGIFLYSSSNNTLNGNNASNTYYGIFLESSSDNNTNNIGILINAPFEGSTINNWNITKQSGTNIIGGPYLGGNFWAYPNGTGFSQTCTDADKDGICDAQYNSNNIDYLPLAFVPAGIKGDLNGNGQSADAGDLILMKRASIGEIIADSRYDLNNNGQFADAGDLVLMKRASIGEINL
jgi:parallel beta-helix repeat protein